MTMWIPSGSTDRKISFVAVDSTDLKTRETGLSSFTVYRRRNGGSATAYTTPTVTEASSSNMPGVYDLLIDEDTTIDSGHDTEETVLHITQASMAPVTLSYILYRPKLTEGQTVTAANSCVDADIERLQGSAIATPTVAGVLEVDVTHFNGSAGTFSSGRPEVNASHISGSSTAADNAEIVFATDFATNYNTTSDKWQVQADVTAISSDSGAADNLEAAYDGAGYAGGTIKQVVDVGSISGDTTAADNLESEYDGTGYGHILQRTTIASLSSQTSFTLTAGSADNDAYNDCIIVIQDASTAAQKAVGVIDDYTGASKTITLRTDPGVFTMATTDIVTIIADRALKPTVMNRTLDVSTGGEAGVDWANVGSQSTSVNLSGTTTNLVNTVTTYTGNTPQTGDSYAIVNSGTHGNAAIKGYVDDIGVAGAGLTAIPWNSAWDAEVQSEVDDALVAQNLDHLVKSAVDTNFATTVHADSVIGQLADNGAGFDRTTDSLEAIRDNMGTAQTGDSYARLGAPAGASVSADIAAVKVDTAAILVDTGTTLDGKIDTIDGIVDSILADTGTDGVVVAAGSKTGYALSTAALAALFTTDSGETYTDAVAGSVVKEIADNAGGSSLSVQDIVDGILDEALSGHTTAGTVAKAISDTKSDTDDIQTRLPAALVGGRMDSSVGAMANNVMTAAAAAADLTTELQSGLATASALSTLDGKVDTVDTVVDAIKAKTDSLTFTVAGQVDSNAKSMNDATINGDGTSGDLWRGA